MLQKLVRVNQYGHLNCFCLGESLASFKCVSDCFEFYCQHLFSMLLGFTCPEYSSAVYAIIFQGANTSSLNDNSFKEKFKKKKKEGEGNNCRKVLKCS